MKRLLAAAAGLAILGGVPALAADDPAPVLSDAVDPPLAVQAAPDTALGAPPAAYPVCRTRTQDRCRLAGQGKARAAPLTPAPAPSKADRAAAAATVTPPANAPADGKPGAPV